MRALIHRDGTRGPVNVALAAEILHVQNDWKTLFVLL